MEESNVGCHYFVLKNDEERAVLEKNMIEMGLLYEDGSFTGLGKCKEIEFEGNKYFVSEKTLRLSHLLHDDVYNPDTYKKEEREIKEWYKWFMKRMIGHASYNEMERLYPYLVETQCKDFREKKSEIEKRIANESCTSLESLFAD